MHAPHNLIPHFIHDRFLAGQTEGSLPAAVLFVDPAGFTRLADEQARHRTSAGRTRAGGGEGGMPRPGGLTQNIMLAESLGTSTSTGAYPAPCFWNVRRNRR